MTSAAKSTEDIIKLIDHVSYKKTEGKLYLMDERLAWMTNTSDSFKISEHYKNIRAQRISPDDKDKVQLQLLMHSGSSFTFQFVHVEGRHRQIADRNTVKTHLQIFIPKFKEKAQSELEHKRKICETNPSILELYRELVANKYVCKEEFWQRTETNIDHQSLLTEYNLYSRGIPSCLLATPPQKDGKSQCNLSKQMVDDIFSVYPAVKQKHIQLVPTEMSEEEFWNKFFQSHYFHRFKSDLSNDKFASCANYDIEQLQKEADLLRRSAHTNPMGVKSVDIGEFVQPTQQSIDRAPIESTIRKTVIVSGSEELLRRFNRQSFLIMKTMKPKDKSTKIETDKTGNLKREKVTVDLDELDSEPVEKRPRLIESTSELYSEEERLAIEKLPVGVIDGVKFNSKKVSEYINRIAGMNNSSLTTITMQRDGRKAVRQMNIEEQQRRLEGLKSSYASICGKPMANLITSSVATDVLTDIGHLFSDADLALSMSNYGSQQSRNRNKIPPEMIRDIRSLYRVSSELFRHFWDCFPVTDAVGFEKLHRMVESIKKFRTQKIEGFVQQHPNFYLLTGSMDTKPTDHLCRMADRISDAFERYLSNYNRLNKIV